MSKRVQLNTRVPELLREKVIQDSERNPRSVTRDVVVASILKDFFSSWSVTERNAFYKQYLNKEAK
jgi:hypothetical protein